MKTVSMVVRVTPEEKAFHLTKELAEVNRELSVLKEQFPPRNECELITDDKRADTCRELKAKHCPRCQATEPLAQDWHKLKARKNNVLKKIHSLGCMALDEH